MGCNSSKSGDVQEARKRERQQAQTASKQPAQFPGSSKATSSRPIGAQGGPSGASDGEEIKFGTSYTDRRQGESDYLKNLVEKTSQNLIDVSQSNVGMDATTVEQRKKDYRERESVRSVLESAVPAISLLSLPAASTTAEDIPALLSSLVEAPKLQFMGTCGQELSSAFLDMTVQDCGDLVIPFGSAT
ncbi:hypothetical protein QOT17_011627 [Balamuthia mandrillaris]